MSNLNKFNQDTKTFEEARIVELTLDIDRDQANGDLEGVRCSQMHLGDAITELKRQNRLEKEQA
tara:strand:- start:150 stop:341 length:192 start_codon:yes stop_codon:yes gene_type:complete